MDSARLEEIVRRQGRWIRRLVEIHLSMLIILVVVMLCGMRPAQEGPADSRVRSLTVLDDKGEAVVRVGLNEHREPEITLIDATLHIPRMRLRLGVFATPTIELLDPLDPKSDDGSRLVLTNEGEPGAPEIRLISQRPKGAERAILAIQMKRSGLGMIEAKAFDGTTKWKMPETE